MAKIEYDLSKMKSRPNPYAKRLKKQITLRIRPDVIDYFKAMAEGPLNPHVPGAILTSAEC